jgi:hypothetical protein
MFPEMFPEMFSEMFPEMFPEIPLFWCWQNYGTYYLFDGRFSQQTSL